LCWACLAITALYALWPSHKALSKPNTNIACG
jgi:hypothetical protein